MSEQIRISQLPEANTVSGNTLIPVVQDGVTERATIDVLTAQIFANAGDIVANSVTLSANAEVLGDESQILSVANSSGDGNGYTTLQLIPDANLSANDQYLIIDPTAPNHIHIRAGGTQDASAAELYLGGENNYVRVQDGSGIRLQNQTRNDTTYYYSDSGTFTTGIWYELDGTYFVQYTTADTELINVTFEFNNDNNNTLLVYYNNGNDSALLTSAGSISSLGGGVYRVTVNEEPPASPTTITAFEYTIWNTRTNTIQLSSNDFSVSVADDIRITGNDTFSLRNESTTSPITIRTDYDGVDHAWEFEADGNLRMPNSGELIFSSGGESGRIVPSVSDGGGLQIQAELDFEIRVNDGESGANIWSFAGSDITFPDNTVQSTAFTGTTISNGNSSVSVPDADGAVVIAVSANDSAMTQHEWQFETGGDLPGIRGPGGAAGFRIYSEELVQIGAQGETADSVFVAQSGEAYIAVGNTAGTAFLTVNSDGVGVTAFGCATPNLSVAGSVNTGGNVNFTGAEETDTARIFVDVAGSTTSLVLEVGDDNADSIVLRHYSFAASNTIDMLTATRASNTTANVSVAGNIGATGNITATNLPTKFSGSWTVPTGNSTQSFTVDGNHTYQMWVEGNIPNGIIAWNALVTVTNTNVPVLGQQFAWNYEGGGNVLMFNTIPAQIIGTAGAISNVEPAVSNTNTFSFGINNASGNTVTVDYGWVKLS